jgi:DNA-binding CsgD family transcriptional regulator
MLSAASIRALQDVQRTLLAPPAAPDAFADWMDAVCRGLRPLLRTDHVYYLEPEGLLGPPAPADADRGPRPPVSQLPAPASAQPSPDAGAPPLRVHSPSAAGTLDAGINRHFRGFADGFSQFREAYPTMQHRLVRSAGPTAVHDAPMHDWGRRQRLDLYQEVFRPVRIDRQLGLSVPLPLGEAMLLAGFPRHDAPDFDGTRHQLLKLLVPAFEASLRFRRHLASADTRLATVLDRLDVALLVFGADGEERHRNAAFGRLVPPGPDAEAVVAAASALARDLLAPPIPEDLPAVRRTVDRPSGPYTLWASPNALLLTDAGVVVSVERASVLPPPQRLQAAFGLTPREAEVALQLAQGRSDQEIADALIVSVHTVRRHTARVLRKLDLSSRAGVALTLLDAG